MSKSLKRVRRALAEANVDTEILETQGARSAQDAANAVQCEIDQIAKSMIFAGASSSQLYLFLTAGSRQVDINKAATLVDEPLGRADAATVRAVTGFAIGGVSPVGHFSPIPAFLDLTLMQFDHVWAAAGTPNHVFRVTPQVLLQISSAQASDFSI